MSGTHECGGADAGDRGHPCLPRESRRMGRSVHHRPGSRQHARLEITHLGHACSADHARGHRRCLRYGVDRLPRPDQPDVSRPRRYSAAVVRHALVAQGDPAVRGHRRDSRRGIDLPARSRRATRGRPGQSPLGQRWLLVRLQSRLARGSRGSVHRHCTWRSRYGRAAGGDRGRRQRRWW